ncbi:hypothetical protein Tco_1417812 [Tanacetum coccineum]
MHNNIMAAGKCILKGPYTPTTVIIPAVPATDNSPAVPERTTVETVLNMSPENKFMKFGKLSKGLQQVAKRQPKTITPPSGVTSEEDSDPENSQKDKEMKNDCGHCICKVFQEDLINLPTTTSELPQTPETRMWILLQDTRMTISLRQFGNQRTLDCCWGTRETVVCQKRSGKDSTYHKEKMLLCKQAEKGVQLQAEQSDWLADTDEEIDKQELEAHYSYMAKIQEVPNADSGTDSEPLEQVQYDIGYNVFANEIQHSEQYESISNTCIVETGDSNVIPDSPDRCDNDIQNDQNAVECDDERVALANLIANLKLNVE